MSEHKRIAQFLFATITLICLLFPGLSLAGMSSTSYGIGHDVLSGGGGDAASSNYLLTATTGQPSATGTSSSSSYNNLAGFWSVRGGGFPLAAGTYYVDIQNGTDDASHGTSSGTGAWRTLHYAVSRINDAVAGTYVLYAAAGTYSVTNGESDEILQLSQDNVTLIGAGAGSTIISASYAEIWNDGLMVDASNVTIKELSVRDFPQYGILLDTGTDRTVQDCEINNNYMGIVIYDASDLVTRNSIWDNEIGVKVWASGAAANPRIENNLIYDTSNIMCYGIEVYADGASASPEIYHNTIDGSLCSGISVLVYYFPAEPVIQYNIISNAESSGIYNDTGNTGTPVSDYNDFWNNAGGSHENLTAGVNDIFEDPLYASYSLQPGSPCIDAIPIGATPGDPVTEDYDLNPRPQGNGFDMGAYEASPAEYTLTVTVSPEGGGSVTDDIGDLDCPGDCSGTYQAGSTPVFTATAEAGYSFAGWDGDVTGTDNPLTLTMDADKTITATFEINTGNSPAEAPTAVSPADGLVFNSTGVTLQASAFSDPENDAHSKTYWRVRQADSVYDRSDYDASFTAETDGSEGTEHAVAGLESGMQYAWMVGYMDAGSGEISWSLEYTFTVGVAYTDNSIDVAPGTETADYRMISFVLWPNDPVATSVFGVQADTTNIRIGTYDPTQNGGAYKEYGSDLKVEPGRAYWILARNGLTKTVDGVAVTTTLDVEVGLLFDSQSENGWNMIGTPNPAEYNWSAVEVVEYDADGNVVFGPTAVSELEDTNAYIDKRLWRWENGAYESDTTRLESRNGYWVQAKKENIFLRFPASKQLAKRSVVQTWVAHVLDSMSRWIGQEVLSPESAVADAGDSPPLPPGDFSVAFESSAASGSGSCFIQSARHN